MNILFFGKHNDEYTDKALNFIKLNANVEDYLGDWKTPFPEEPHWWRGEYIVSYLSRWIVPQSVIDRATKGAINFHPGPPEYPGIGCVNFALYDNAYEFGVTCHYLAHPVDSGTIIDVKRFPVFHTDTVTSLLTRTHDYLLCQFYDVMGEVLQGNPLLIKGTKWGKTAYTRKQLDKLAEITGSMTDEEIAKRARACVYGDFGLTFRGRKLA